MGRPLVPGLRRVKPMRGGQAVTPEDLLQQEQARAGARGHPGGPGALKERPLGRKARMSKRHSEAHAVVGGTQHTPDEQEEQAPSAKDTHANLQSWFGGLIKGQRGLMLLAESGASGEGDHGSHHDDSHHDEDHHDEGPPPPAPSSDDDEEVASRIETLKAELAEAYQAFQQAHDGKQHPDVDPEGRVVVVHDEHYSSEEWHAAIADAQSECSADAATFCGDYDPHHDGSDHGDHHDYHHHRRQLSHHGEHHPPGHHHSGCHGPLGFGSREADKCMRDHKDQLSPSCTAAIQVVEDMLASSPQSDDSDEDEHHHHGAGGCLLLLVVILVSLACCVRCGHKCRRMRRIHRALLANRELKQAVQDAAGTPVPSLRWRRKVFAALQANPSLKNAVDAAIVEQAKIPAGHRSQHPGARCAGRCLKSMAFALLGCFIMALLLGSGSTSPLVGFLFAVIGGMSLILILSLVYQATRALCTLACHGAEADYQPVVVATETIPTTKVAVLVKSQPYKASVGEYEPPPPPLPLV
uniref:Uncharacterized protein n=1 Tax=Rhizochromulina marina TaxID=1034831 RepID=A0A7S2SWP1_9STRA